jgi:hypothetical protein
LNCRFGGFLCGRGFQVALIKVTGSHDRHRGFSFRDLTPTGLEERAVTPRGYGLGYEIVLAANRTDQQGSGVVHFACACRKFYIAFTTHNIRLHQFVKG